MPTSLPEEFPMPLHLATPDEVAEKRKRLCSIIWEQPIYEPNEEEGNDGPAEESDIAYFPSDPCKPAKKTRMKRTKENYVLIDLKHKKRCRMKAHLKGARLKRLLLRHKFGSKK
ncbi:unnamed protein product [Soboliphyme baturini]|uniref:Uncharacterized protein n=1 Tax=Soboliphyme baturini TaxID=241478 RepID=A0A183J7P2_9BILA|nr:unnamed protein product [Soboliphyme baturini]